MSAGQGVSTCVSWLGGCQPVSAGQGCVNLCQLVRGCQPVSVGQGGQPVSAG